jgi:hypothetical protein
MVSLCHPQPAFRSLDYEDEPGRRSGAKLLSGDEARRIAVNIARLPELLGPYDASSQKLRMRRTWLTISASTGWTRLSC